MFSKLNFHFTLLCQRRKQFVCGHIDSTVTNNRLLAEKIVIVPNARNNEIDYVLSDPRRILKDVSVVPSFSTGRGHPLYLQVYNSCC